MYRRSPLGNPLLWIVACLVLPEVVKKCKPLAKTVGDVLVKAGESFRKASEEPEKPAAEAHVTEEAPAEAEAHVEAEHAAPKATHKKSKASPAEPAEGEPAPEA